MSDREIMSTKSYRTIGGPWPPKEESVANLSKEITKYMPDQRKHRIASFAKSAVRIVGYAALPFSLWTGVILLIVSEGIGIIEELV